MVLRMPGRAFSVRSEVVGSSECRRTPTRVPNACVGAQQQRVAVRRVLGVKSAVRTTEQRFRNLLLPEVVRSLMRRHAFSAQLVGFTEALQGFVAVLFVLPGKLRS